MALIQNIEIIDKHEYLHSYSNAGFYIEQTDTGCKYDEAFDPIGNPLNHTYTETNEPIEDEPADDENVYAELGKILFGEED